MFRFLGFGKCAVEDIAVSMKVRKGIVVRER